MKTSNGNISVLSALSLSFVVLVLTVLPISGHAQEWKVEPIIKVGGEYDDNATLNIRTDQEVDLSGALFDLSADIQYNSARTTFNLQPRAVVREYDESQYSSDDYFLESDLRHLAGRSVFGFRSTYERQDVRTAERATSDLDIDDPDVITDDDTGRVILTGTRDKLRFSPYWEKRLSNVSLIRTTVDYYDVSYDDVLAGTLTDYDDVRLSVDYAHGFSDVNTALLTVTGRRYDRSSGQQRGDVSGYGVLGGFNHEFSEKMDITVMLGIEDTDPSGSASADPNVVGNVTLKRDLETIRMFARYRRSVNATGAGRLSVRDAVNLGFRRRLSEKITAGLGIRAYQSRGVDDDDALDDRDYIQLQSNFQFYLTQSLLLETSYRYTISDRSSGIGERSNSNQINIWFIYQPRTVPRI